ncbi:MAG: hypothetical protein E6H73_18330, partial [Betaproteobacteria bacterium]
MTRSSSSRFQNTRSTTPKKASKGCGRTLPKGVTMKWIDTREIAIALAEAHPDTDP